MGRIFLLVLLLAFVSAFVSGCAKEKHTSFSALQPMQTEVVQTVEALDQAQTLQEWRSSGKTPIDLFNKLRLLADNKTQVSAAKELCAQLEKLNFNDLVVFESELENSQAEALLPCTSDLLKRIEGYWNQTSHELALLDDVPASHFAEPTSMPATAEVFVDTTTGPIFYNGGLKKGEIALTFDDGPHPTRTDRILKTLGEHGVRATFFQVGEMVQRFPNFTHKIFEAGHTVGSHTWGHPQLSKMSLKAAKQQITSARDLVALKSTGFEAPFFRFPYGDHRADIQKFIQAEQMATFFWNMDSSDWKLRDPAVLFKNIAKEIDREKGGIILMHDIQEQTAIVLPRVLDLIKSRGMKTVVFIPVKKPVLP